VPRKQQKPSLTIKVHSDLMDKIVTSLKGAGKPVDNLTMNEVLEAYYELSLSMYAIYERRIEELSRQTGG
jgi:hypothetical protein